MVLFDANKPEKGQSSYMDEKGAGEPGAGHFNVYDHASLSLSFLSLYVVNFLTYVVE